MGMSAQAVAKQLVLSYIRSYNKADKICNFWLNTQLIEWIVLSDNSFNAFVFADFCGLKKLGTFTLQD